MKLACIVLFLFQALPYHKAVASTSEFVKISESQLRTSSLGFSFKTPTGDNWYEGYSPQTLIYLKRTRTADLTIHGSATEIEFNSEHKTADNLLSFVKSYKEVKDTNRFKNVTSKLTINNSKNIVCIDYEEQAEDHEAQNLNGRDYLLINNIGRVCMDPEERNHLIDIRFSIRRPSQTKIDDFISEGYTFINSLVYQPQ